MPDKILLKDILFNKTKVAQLADEITQHYPSFRKNDFIHEVVSQFSQLELKQRISWISQCLRKYLPPDYKDAVKIILKSLPQSNNPNLTDDDFGDFIHAPYADFIAKYGCNKPDLQLSFHALKEITQRFSAEDAIRYFINAFPNETMVELLKWSKDSHYHVRRLVSEGTRPKLPWSQKISIDAKEAIPLLDNLFSDKTRFVTRSVANHLNDISKTNPDLVLEVLKKWQVSGKQDVAEMNFINKHSLRTLIKKGYAPAFSFLQFSQKVDVKLSNFKIENDLVKIGSALTFSFSLTAAKDENLLIDYGIFFQNKKGEMNSKKVFKLKKININKNQTIYIQKAHPMREHMTTRTIYPGKHKVEIQINGNVFISEIFQIVR
jgi:3-methyladenine DNA glycosylase AlkC